MNGPPSRGLAILLALGIAAIALPVHLRPQNFPTDDAYFYLQVAHHIERGHGSNFNEITRTNGYHPLWMLFCVAASRVAHGDKQLTLHIVLALQQLLFAGTVLLLHRLALCLCLRYAYVAVPVLAAALLATANHGVESSLNGLALLACLLGLEVAVRSDNRVAWLRAGALLGLCILSRLDNIFLVATFLVAATLAKWKGWRRAPVKLLDCLLPLAALVLPYMLFNRLSFGHWIPISGAIKSRFPQVGLHLETLGCIGIVSILGGVVSIAVSMRSKGRRRWVLCALGSGVTLHGAYMLLFVHDNVLTWAYVAGMVNLALLVALVAEALVPRVAALVGVRAAHGLLASGALLFLGMAALRVWSDFHNPDARGLNPLQFRRQTGCKWQNDIALWLRENLPARARLYAQQWPGAIAYFSDRACLPEDGLMGDYAYDRDLLAMGLEKYLQDHDVGFFLGPYPPWNHKDDSWTRATLKQGSWHVECRTPLTRRLAGGIQLRDADLLVRFDEHLDNPSMPPYALWRLGEQPPNLRAAAEMTRAEDRPDQGKKRPSPK